MSNNWTAQTLNLPKEHSWPGLGSCSLIILSPWLAQWHVWAGGDRLDTSWSDSLQLNSLLFLKARASGTWKFLWEWKFRVYFEILQFNYTDQNILGKIYLWFYLFNIHIFHIHVSHSFRYMHNNGLSYISLNKQTFVASNILHGRWNWTQV